MAAKSTELRQVDGPALIWDWPTRLFHWATAVLVVAAYATWSLGLMDWHVRVGEALLALVLFRALWGLWGSETARFSKFIAGPRTVAAYLAQLFRREPAADVGHNAAGGWMVIFLLALLLAQALTGIYVNNDVADQGPFTDMSPAALANAITAMHDVVIWDVLLAAIALHVSAILFYRVIKGQNLLSPMITGRRVLPAGAAAPRVESLLRAAVLFLCATAAALALAAYM